MLPIQAVSSRFLPPPPACIISSCSPSSAPASLTTCSCATSTRRQMANGDRNTTVAHARRNERYIDERKIAIFYDIQSLRTTFSSSDFSIFSCLQTVEVNSFQQMRCIALRCRTAPRGATRYDTASGVNVQYTFTVFYTHKAKMHKQMSKIVAV